MLALERCICILSLDNVKQGVIFNPLTVQSDNFSSPKVHKVKIHLLLIFNTEKQTTKCNNRIENF